MAHEDSGQVAKMTSPTNGEGCLLSYPSQGEKTRRLGGYDYTDRAGCGLLRSRSDARGQYVLTTPHRQATAMQKSVLYSTSISGTSIRAKSA
jgi:hypothetical protein